MNLLANIHAILNPQSQSLAKITGKKQDGTWIASDLGGHVVLLTGQASIGVQVFYDRYTRQIINQAPNVDFKRFGV